MAERARDRARPRARVPPVDLARPPHAAHVDQGLRRGHRRRHRRRVATTGSAPRTSSRPRPAASNGSSPTCSTSPGSTPTSSRSHRVRSTRATSSARRSPGSEPSARDFGVTLRVAAGDAVPADARSRAARADRRQPRGERAEVRGIDGGGRRRPDATAASWSTSTTTAPASRPTSASACSSGSTPHAGRPVARSAPASASRSCTSSRSTMGGTARARTVDARRRPLRGDRLRLTRSVPGSGQARNDGLRQSAPVATRTVTSAGGSTSRRTIASATTRSSPETAVALVMRADDLVVAARPRRRAAAPCCRGARGDAGIG